MKQRIILNKIFFLIVVCLSFIYQGNCKYVNADEETVFDMNECSVSPQNAEPGDIVTWKLKTIQDYGSVDIALELQTPKGKVILPFFAPVYRNYEDDCYSIDYEIPDIGAGDGEYQINRIRIYCYDTGESIIVNSGETDLSSLKFTVNGQEEDITEPDIDKENIVIRSDEENIYIDIPMTEQESGIQETDLEIVYFDIKTNSWEYFVSRGFLREGWLNESGGVTVIFQLSDFEKNVVYGIKDVRIIDNAGNNGYVSIINTNDIAGSGIDAIPEKWRFTLEQSGDSLLSHVHEYSKEWTIDVPPTCLEKGSKSHHCTSSSCNSKIDITEIPPTGQHTYGEWTVIQQPMFGCIGIKERFCAKCGTKEQEVIPQMLEYTNSVGTFKLVMSSAENKEVAFIAPKSNKKSNVTIPAAVTIDGKIYKVTEVAPKAFKNNKKVKTVTIGKNVTKIGKEAFSGCKNLKTITIKSTSLKSVEKNAIKNINENATIKVPKKQLSKYKKLFKDSTGYKKSMKIKQS